MSSAQSLKNKLKALQCHFTWDLNPRKPRLITLQKILKDISTEEGNFWLGPIYNLQGFIQNQLGSPEEALSSFNQATETFQQQKHADEGPWLMVNFGNLAWLHHLMGEDEKSQDYLSKVDALQKKKEELHPEVCAEKAWTLMKFDKEKKQQAAELFQRAIQMQPDVVEWQSSYAILRAEAFKDNMENMESQVFKILRSAKERDPGNLYVAALYLEARAAKGELIQGEVEMLAKKVLKAAVSAYSGLSLLLRLYRNHKSKDDAVKLAKEALETHPDSRYLKRSVAICLSKKVLSPEYNPESLAIQDVIDLWEEVKEAYHGSSTREDLTLAGLYAKIDIGKADRTVSYGPGQLVSQCKFSQEEAWVKESRRAAGPTVGGGSSTESGLRALQCHFTWDLEASRQSLIYLRYGLKDVGTDEGNFWLGPIYNLQGFIQNQLGSPEEALSSFNQATETFQRQKHADESPWLMVNFGNLAWLHHLMGEDEKSQDYLSKVDALQKKKEELHPEVCAEKAWTLMKFDKEKKQQAAELFQRAIQMQPDVVEWQSSCAILRAQTLEAEIKKLYADRLEELRSAKERDPENLCVAALYLGAQAAAIKQEARELAERVLESPMNNFSGINPLLTLFKKHISADEAVEIVKEALRRNPDSRYTKRSAAKWYTKKIFSERSNPDSTRIDRAISLWEEVIAAYPQSSLKEKIYLADVYAKKDKDKADQIYKELLDQRDLDPAERQMLFCRYAKHLYFSNNEKSSSIEFHLEAAKIPEESKYRRNSIRELEKTLERNEDTEMCEKIKEFFTTLNVQPSEPSQE
ncbi:uncharacterized protein V3H82_010019 [Fundulus diaphanus]